MSGSHFDEIGFNGWKATTVIGAESVYVLIRDQNEMVLLATGTTVPTDATAGYADGCLFIDSDAAAGSILYVNEGSTTSSDFNAVGIGSGSALTLQGAFANGKVITGAGSLANAMQVGDASAKLQVYSDATDIQLLTSAGDLIITPFGGDTKIVGNLAVDTSTLVVNGSTNRVGILVAAPTVALDVLGNTLLTGDMTLTGTFTHGGTYSPAAISTGAGTFTGLITASGGLSGDGWSIADTTGIITVSGTGSLYVASGNIQATSGEVHAGVFAGVAAATTFGSVSYATTVRGSTITLTDNSTFSGTLAITGATTATGAIYANGGVDRSGAATLSIGATNANAISVSKSGVLTTVLGALTSTEDFAVGASVATIASATGNTILKGTLTCGNIAAYAAGADVALTINAKGSGTMTIGGTSTGNITIGGGGGNITLAGSSLACGSLVFSGIGATMTATAGLAIATGAAGTLSLNSQGAGVITIGGTSTGNITLGTAGHTTLINNTTGQVTVEAGGLTVTAGNIVATAGNISTGAGSITAANGLTVSAGTVSVPAGSITIAALETSLKEAVRSIPVNFAAAGVGTFRLYFNNKVTINRVRSVVTGALAASDDGTVTLQNSAGAAMNNGVVTIAASAAVGDLDSCVPDSNNVVTADDYINVVVAKTTPNGTAWVDIEYTITA